MTQILSHFEQTELENYEFVNLWSLFEITSHARKERKKKILCVLQLEKLVTFDFTWHDFLLSFTKSKYFSHA